MMDEPSTILEPEGIFRPRKQATSRAVLWLLGGIAASFQEPIIGYGLPAVGALLGVFLLGAGIFLFCGWTIDLDSKTSRLAIKRLGTGK